MTIAHNRKRKRKGRKPHRGPVCNATESDIRRAVGAVLPDLPDPMKPKDGEPSASSVMAGGVMVSKLVIEWLKKGH